MAGLTIKRGDTLPAVEASLLENGVPVCLTGAFVHFVYIYIVDGKRYERTATVVSEAGGTVRYDWVEGDTDVPGKYRAHWRVTFPTLDAAGNNQVEHWPRVGYIDLVIEDDV